MAGERASERFAAHAVAVQLAALPADVASAVAAFTSDTIGVGIGGSGSAYISALRAAALKWGDGAEASVWATGERLPRANAAFLNAFQAHCQEFDCVHEGAVLHPFTVVVPVLLAEAEAQGMSGADYIAACAAGVDVAAGLGCAARSQIKFFRPATYGLFGATAALARARGLDAEACVHAFGYALAFASGTMQAHVEGTPALAVQVGNAARAAFHAVDMAEAGLPGPRGAIDGPFGLMALFETESDLGPVLAGLGRIWRAGEVSFKPHPTGRAAHGGIDMALSLRAQGVGPADIVSIQIDAPPLIHHLVGRPIAAPLEVNYARLCLPYAVACAFMRGGVGLADFTPAALADPAVHALAARVVVAKTAIADPAAFVPQRLVARLTDGSEREVAIEALPGARARPFSPPAQRAKLSQCVAFGFGLEREDVAEGIWRCCADLAHLPDVGVLARLATGRA